MKYLPMWQGEDREMNLIQYISFSMDKAIEMLIDNQTSKMDVALFLMDFKKILNKPEKEIVDGYFKEVEIKGTEDRRLIE
jgi:hypothetical protein